MGDEIAKDLLKGSSGSSCYCGSTVIWNLLFNSTHTHHMVKLRRGDKLFLGLSEENMKRLPDQPIKFNGQQLGLGDIDIWIFTGKDEESMAQFLGQLVPKDIPQSNNPQQN